MNKQERKDRIEDEVFVDCYDEYEMAMGWFYYIEDNLTLPFKAKVLENSGINGLEEGEIVEVYEFTNSSEDEVSIDNFVPIMGIQTEEHIYDIPLQSLQGIDCDEVTENVIEDWRYWCESY